MIALSATAAPPVRAEIVERLGMRDPAIVVLGFDRPNIHLAVETFGNESDKRATLLDRVVSSPRPGIVYAATRRATEELAEALTERGIAAAAYHAGLRASERETIQSGFMADEIEVVVATIAFGMGIDKPNVRFVYHHDISDSLDSYYQEIGRSGRDGEQAEAILFYVPEDLALRRFQTGAGHLEVDEVKPVIRALTRVRKPVRPSLLRDNTNLSDSLLTRIINRLEDVGAVDIQPDGQVKASDSTTDPAQAARAAVDEQDRHRGYARPRLEMMRQYAEFTGCRRRFPLNYFGETRSENCEFCDICESGSAQECDADTCGFPPSSQVGHISWGTGTVMHVKDDVIVVLFETVGYKTLSIDLLTEQGLLQLAPVTSHQA